jgi:hypothetical protein
MGLDQYASARKGEPVQRETTYDVMLDDGTEEERIEYYNEWEDQYEITTWRKHPHLQGFMEQLWIDKGCPGLDPARAGSMFGSDFNCVDLVLTLGDIDSLEEHVKGESLPETEGFFFGDDASEYYREDDLEFCNNARKAIADGYTVIYSSWW